MDRHRRHQPFGNGGYNPEGVRIGGEIKHKRALKVWDQREFKNLDNTKELGTRNIKIALRRLRKFAREGAQDELDIDGTIDGTARQGWLDIVMRAERRNAVKLLLFLDVGGSMDPFVKLCEELFRAATTEFKNLEFFYFHNCPYEGVWKDNNRRFAERTPMWDVLHKFGHDYKLRVRRRRVDEPVRDHPPRRLGRAFQRGIGRGVAAPADHDLSGGGVAQPGARGAMGLFAVGEDHPRTDDRPHVPADAGRPGRGDARADAEALDLRAVRPLHACARNSR